VVPSLFGALSWRDKVRKRSHLPSSSPSCEPPSKHPKSNTNQPTKYPQMMEFAVHSTITTCGHQFLLLAKSYIHNRGVSTLSHVVFVLLCVFSFFSVFPIRGNFFISVLLLTHRGVLSGSYTLPLDWSGQ